MKLQSLPNLISPICNWIEKLLPILAWTLTPQWTSNLEEQDGKSKKT